MKTKAAILVEQNKPLEINEVELPKLSYGQVLVDIYVSRICGSQLGEIAGVKGPDPYLPHLLGHEAGGIVREIGPKVSHVKAGDRVALHWRPGKGIDAGGSVYQWQAKACNAGPITTFQKQAVISENRITVVPKHTDFELCALLADTLTTGFGTIVNDAKVKIGESLVIIGCGGIGLGAVLGARLAGAYPIIAVDIQEHKLDKAKKFGASHTINSSKDDFLEIAQEVLKGKADVVIDGTGKSKVIEKAFSLTAPQGRCIIIGVMHYQDKLALNTLPLHFGKAISASHGGDSQPSSDIPRYLRMIEAGLFNPSEFISHRCSLEQINAAIDTMRSGESIHTMIHLSNN